MVTLKLTKDDTDTQTFEALVHGAEVVITHVRNDAFVPLFGGRWCASWSAGYGREGSLRVDSRAEVESQLERAVQSSQRAPRGRRMECA